MLPRHAFADPADSSPAPFVRPLLAALGLLLGLLGVAGTVFLGTAIFATAAEGATVPPNPLSLLKGKSVLVVQPTYPTDYHPAPRATLTTKIGQMKNAVGFNLTVLKGVDTMTLAAMNRYDIILFNYFTKLELLEPQPFGKAFVQWLAEGNHGVVAVHNSLSESEGEWDWFRDSVQSMRYIDHKDASQTGTVHITTDPAVAKLPVLDKMDATFTGEDEWYSFDMPPKAAAAPTWGDCKVLYYMDENSVAHLTDKMGVHPTTWIREDGRHNRYFTTLHIHSDAGANSDFYYSLILRALEYTAGYQEPVSIAGQPLGSSDAGAIATRGRRLDVNMDGAFRLEVVSAAGRIVFTAEGRGTASFSPSAFDRPGLYLVSLESASERDSQAQAPQAKIIRRVMIY